VAAIEPVPGRLVLSSLEQVDLELLKAAVATRV
jgi:hypothetical protein